MIRLESMDETEFQGFVDRAIRRRAAKWAERGLWTEADGLEACQRLYQRRLPKGRETPGNHFAKVMDSDTNAPVGEIWYEAEREGGKLQFTVEWIQIEPEFRRRGYASAALHSLEEMAARHGADRIHLTVWTDNPGAMELYSKLGYRPLNVDLSKRLPSQDR